MPDRELLQAVSCLPPQLRAQLQTIQGDTVWEEIRLRAGCPLTASSGRTEAAAEGRPLTPQQLQDTVDRACNYSVHTFSSNIAQGFVTLPGGHRIGICGEAVWENGRIVSFRSISSLNIRIARQVRGAADDRLLGRLKTEHGLRSALFFSPPRFGKTTLLRDTARRLSEDGFRVGIADERGELAALYRGQPQFDLGTRCDVVTGCPKAEAALMLVRTMSPDAVVLDEITGERDIHAALGCSHCGVAVLASAHADSIEDFKTRPLYRKLLESRVFDVYFRILPDRTVEEVSFGKECAVC